MLLPNAVTVTREPRGLLARLRGEMSNLRRAVQVALHGGLLNDYRLDSTRVNYSLARGLYRNTDDRYKLGGGFAKPIVNTTAGFMGAPKFKHENEEASRQLEETFTRWQGKLLQINRDTLRDGDCYARVGLQPAPFGQEPALDLWTIPPEWCEPRFRPLTREWESFSINHPVEVLVEVPGGGVDKRTGIVREVITPDTVEFRVDDPHADPAIRALARAPVENPSGFIPIVHFRNEAEEGALYGVSELEAVEPFLKAYHDVALHAIQGSRLFSRPKVKFKLKDVQSFLRNNFSAAELAGGQVNFAGKELFLMHTDDDAAFISADQDLPGVAALLEIVFLCIVDVSETPEFAFGAGVQSSRGSVAEQQVPLTRKIARKRGQFAEPYAELARLYLTLWARAEGITLARGQVDVVWDELSAKDEVNTATALRTTAEALMMLVKMGLLSPDAAAEHLRTIVPTMLPWDQPGAGPTEKGRVVAGLAFIKKVLEDTGQVSEQDRLPPGDRGQGRPPGPGRRAVASDGGTA